MYTEFHTLEVNNVIFGYLLSGLYRSEIREWRELCSQVRNAPVVTPDETGWRVGAIPHWLWA